MPYRVLQALHKTHKIIYIFLMYQVGSHIFDLQIWVETEVEATIHFLVAAIARRDPSNMRGCTGSLGVMFTLKVC